MAAAALEDDTPTNSLLLTIQRTFVELPTAWALRLHPGLAQGVGESGRETCSPSKLPQGEGGANAKLLTVPNSYNLFQLHFTAVGDTLTVLTGDCCSPSVSQSQSLSLDDPSRSIAVLGEVRCLSFETILSITSRQSSGSCRARLSPLLFPGSRRLLTGGISVCAVICLKGAPGEDGGEGGGDGMNFGTGFLRLIEGRP